LVLNPPHRTLHEAPGPSSSSSDSIKAQHLIIQASHTLQRQQFSSGGLTGGQHNGEVRAPVRDVVLRVFGEPLGHVQPDGWRAFGKVCSYVPFIMPERITALASGAMLTEIVE